MARIPTHSHSFIAAIRVPTVETAITVPTVRPRTSNVT